MHVSKSGCVISIVVSSQGGESEDALQCRFQKMMQMSGTLHEAESQRHLPGKDYENRQKEDH